MYNTIQYATEGPVATVTLNRPERKNAIGPEMVNELLYALDAASRDEGIRVVVLGANGKTFSAGGDLGQMAAGGAGGAGGALPNRGDYADLLLALVKMTKPVVARVQGHAMGGGLGLVAASAMAIASTDAQLGTPEVNVGLFPMMIMAVLARTIPRRALLEMMLLGARIDAAEAERIGLVNRAVAPERLEAEVHRVVGELAQKSPTALARGLAAYGRMGDMALDAALPMLRDELYALLATEDAREGLMAFMEKRAPRWTGR
jgi:enoyl-CoA hydratase/carnithine racemase